MREVIFKKRIPGQIDKIIYRSEMSVIPRKDEYVCLTPDGPTMLVTEVLWILLDGQTWVYVK